MDARMRELCERNYVPVALVAVPTDPNHSRHGAHKERAIGKSETSAASVGAHQVLSPALLRKSSLAKCLSLHTWDAMIPYFTIHFTTPTLRRRMAIREVPSDDDCIENINVTTSWTHRAHVLATWIAIPNEVPSTFIRDYRKPSAPWCDIRLFNLCH